MKLRLLSLLGILLGCPVWASAQQRIPLAGYWERWVGNNLYDNVWVPSSYRPIGTARLVRTVEFPALTPRQRIVLRFEGIAGNGTLLVNGHEAGFMGPYARYDFDITPYAKAGKNTIEVDITDWQVPTGLGPTAAWEAYGGIVYDAYAEIHSDPYIGNARLSYKLSDDFKSVDCRLDVFVADAHPEEGVHVSAELRWGQTQVIRVQRTANAAAGNSTISLQWKMDNVHLWSPADPALYSLSVHLSSPGGEDTFAQDTGFRSLTIQGNRFYLNGRQFVFKGVARHNMWGGEGFSLTGDQIEQDFQMIKSMGANSVRLVHYPHDPQDLEAAEHLGLFVSEESGITWINFRDAPASVLKTGIGNLEREVKRDWNNPALFAVLLANESTPTVPVMREARERIRALKPDLFMSMPGPSAPDHNPETMKKMFDDGGFDFYTAHPYTYDPRTFAKVAEIYSTKPLIFSEWGGPVGRLPRMMDEEVQALGKLVEQSRLAGHWFWEWADMPQFAREDISMENGILSEGVVTQDRHIKYDVFSRLTQLYSYTPGLPPAPPRQPTLLAPGALAANASSRYISIPLQPIAAQQTSDWQQLETSIAAYWKANDMSENYWQQSGGHFWTWDAPFLRVGPIPFGMAQVEDHTRPLVILNGKTVEIPAQGIEADRLHFLGNATVPDGYPTRGSVGEQLGSYIVVYRDGERQEIPLRWGLEVARSNTLAVATRLNPVAIFATPAIQFDKQLVHERYRTFLYSVEIKRKPIDRILVTVKPLPASRPLISRPNATGSGYSAGDTALLLFGITGAIRRCFSLA